MLAIQDVVRRLRDEYGAPHRPDTLPDPIDELVQTILSQNTSDANTERAFASLKRAFLSWQDVIEADTELVVDAIRSGGLANQKASRIQRVLGHILSETGTFDLRFLNEMPVEDARRWLTCLPGVGPKTAACVLLFSLDRPAMPVDTHVHRVSLRLGLIPPGTSADKAHDMIGPGLTSDETYEAHMLLIRHGRQTCKAGRPRCGFCALNDVCPSARTTVTWEEHGRQQTY